MKHKQSAFIGKEYQIFQDNKPISSDRFEETLTQYKLQMEATVRLDPYILTAGHKAIGYYKQRS